MFLIQESAFRLPKKGWGARQRRRSRWRLASRSSRARRREAAKRSSITLFSASSDASSGRGVRARGKRPSEIFGGRGSRCGGGGGGAPGRSVFPRPPAVPASPCVGGAPTPPPDHSPGGGRARHF